MKHSVQHPLFSKFNINLERPIPDEEIDLEKLVLITISPSNDQKAKIEELRKLKIENEEEYRRQKIEMPHVTPACLVKRRKLSKKQDFKANFIAATGYIYFDIDNVENADLEKEKLIQTYGSLISFACKSLSNRGLSFIVKVTNPINSSQDYEDLWIFLSLNQFKDLNLDPKVKNISRAMMISYDPEPFVNYSNQITIHPKELDEFKKQNAPAGRKKEQANTNPGFAYFLIPPIYEPEQKLVIETPIQIEKPLVDVFGTEFISAKVFKIEDDFKHKIYTRLIHILIRLNPEIHPYYMFNYLDFLNREFADPPMIRRTLIRLFDYVYQSIKNDEEYQFKKLGKKKIHFNQDFILTKTEKKKIIEQIKGLFRKNLTIARIIEAKQTLQSQGLKITQKAISEVSGIPLRTVKRYYRVDQPYEIEEFLNLKNSESFLKSLNAPVKSRLRDWEFPSNQQNEFHPNCPAYVIDYLMKTKLNSVGNRRSK